MAYSDYGGYGYRNGQKIDERSDAVITLDGGNLGQPGIYPGFVAVAAGRTPQEFDDARSKSVDGHVVLGDGPVYCALYKQSSLQIYVRNEDGFAEVNLLEAGVDLPAEAIGEYKGKRYLDSYAAKENGLAPLRFDVSGATVEVVWEETDNHYQYVRLIQPDGAVWTGFSGYGVGAGLEDCGYGYSTEECEARLFDIFPAQGTSAGTAETGTGSGLQPAGPVGSADAPER